jgi:hypothetical protein
VLGLRHSTTPRSAAKRSKSGCALQLSYAIELPPLSLGVHCASIAVKLGARLKAHVRGECLPQSQPSVFALA